MPYKIVRNDITKMQCDAIVNTANPCPVIGEGCDTAIYNAAGREELLAFRKEHIGEVEEGASFITPAFKLPVKFIIHTVSPVFIDGDSGEEDKLRLCYRNSLKLAAENEVQSIAFPLISTGSFGYPKEEGLRIAIDEINAFLMKHDMMIYIVVFGQKATELGKKISAELEAYIDENYVQQKFEEEYGVNSERILDRISEPSIPPRMNRASRQVGATDRIKKNLKSNRFSSTNSGAADFNIGAAPESKDLKTEPVDFNIGAAPKASKVGKQSDACYEDMADIFDEDHENKLAQRIKHMSDTYSEYLLYIIENKGMTNAEVYKRALVDKKVFSKLKSNPDYHPNKMTAMCLCVGARLNIDETKDLLARAGYALSPCDMTDVIFSYFIENEIYDMFELDIQLEEHGLKYLVQ